MPPFTHAYDKNAGGLLRGAPDPNDIYVVAIGLNKILHKDPSDAGNSL